MKKKFVIPDRLPTFTTIEELKAWLNDARYVEPDHRSRSNGRALYDKARKTYFQPFFHALFKKDK